MTSFCLNSFLFNTTSRRNGKREFLKLVTQTGQACKLETMQFVTHTIHSILKQFYRTAFFFFTRKSHQTFLGWKKLKVNKDYSKKPIKFTQKCRFRKQELITVAGSTNDWWKIAKNSNNTTKKVRLEFLPLSAKKKNHSVFKPKMCRSIVCRYFWRPKNYCFQIFMPLWQSNKIRAALILCSITFRILFRDLIPSETILSHNCKKG